MNIKKEEINKIEQTITYKKRVRPPKNLYLNNQNQQSEKEISEVPYKSKMSHEIEDFKSDGDKSNKEKKSLPTLLGPSSSNPIRKIIAHRTLQDYMKNINVGNSFQDNETLQKETMNLKERLNELTVQNMKLKTKAMSLQSENLKIQKILQQSNEIKYPGNKQSKMKSSQQTIINLKMIIRDTKKQLQELKEQKLKQKKSLKYTRVVQLQNENKWLQDQTIRLRQLLQQQIADNLNNKISIFNKSELQQQCASLQHSNNLLKKQLLQYSKKVKTFEEKIKAGKSEMDKNMNRTILELKKVVREKTIELEGLKKQNQNQIKGKGKPSQQKVANLKCEHCKSKNSQIKRLKQKICCLQDNLKRQRESISIDEIIIKYPTQQQLNNASNFLKYRFQAHHIVFSDLQSYLIKTTSDSVSVGSMVQNLLSQPFFLINPAYLQSVIAYLFYSDHQTKEIKIDQSYQKKSRDIKQSFLHLIEQYQLLDIKIQEQFYLQIAQIVTNYCEHISAAFESKRNGEGTISKSSLVQFLQHIQLQQQYIQFIITQIVLESADLEHLNYYSFFEIFYVPNNNISKKLPEAVKELDEQYEESQSQDKNSERSVDIQDDLNYEEDFDASGELNKQHKTQENLRLQQ